MSESNPGKRLAQAILILSGVLFIVAGAYFLMTGPELAEGGIPIIPFVLVGVGLGDLVFSWFFFRN